MYKKIDEFENLDNDGLLLAKVRKWSIAKHRIVGYYSTLFSSIMRKTWNELVYIDTFCGPGNGEIEDTGSIIATSPLRALDVEKPFSKYIFCDKKIEYIDALTNRVVTKFGNERNVSYITGDINKCYNKVISEVPKGPRVLSLCFLDPNDIGIHFRTVHELSKIGNIDFLILLALGMDAKRNFWKNYLPESSTKVENFLDDPDWRSKWINFAGKYGEHPILFLSREYFKNMNNLGYLMVPFEWMHPVYDGPRFLYYLALFSKAKRAYDFWRDTLDSVTSQRSLFS